MDEVDIPSYFLCPISLQIMRDPVTLPSGITYDRDNIEHWLFSGKSQTCPLTKQRLASDAELTPNHTLRRLIQAWCASNASRGIERFPTPRAPVDKAMVSVLLDEVKSQNNQLNSLRKLNDLVAFSDRNRRCAIHAGAVVVLLSIIADDNIQQEEEFKAREEALRVLHTLRVSDANLPNLASNVGALIGVLMKILNRCSNNPSRANAVFLLKSIVKSTNPARLVNLDDGVFVGIVKVIADRISSNVTKSAVRVLTELCPWGRNRVKATEADAVKVLLELLIEERDKRTCELILVVLEVLCGCADGRQELLGHAAGVAVVANRIVRVSDLATDRGVRILHSVLKYSASPELVKDMLEVGVVPKLCLVINADCGVKTKEKAKEMLRLHSRVWKNSPCIAPQLQAFYPS